MSGAVCRRHLANGRGARTSSSLFGNRAPGVDGLRSSWKRLSPRGCAWAASWQRGCQGVTGAGLCPQLVCCARDSCAQGMGPTRVFQVLPAADDAWCGVLLFLVIGFLCESLFPFLRELPDLVGGN